MYFNDFATLTEYKVSKRKSVADYVIRFHSEQTDITAIVNLSFDIFKQLVEKYHRENKMIKGRLIALVNYVHLENENNVSYYHTSFQSEVINDAEKFFHAHMLKIAKRMDNMNHHGSNLMIKNIEEVHIHITAY